MKIFGISNHGLAAITVLTAVLWGVIFLEHAINRQALQDYQELQQAWPASISGESEHGRPARNDRPEDSLRSSSDSNALRPAPTAGA